MNYSKREIQAIGKEEKAQLCYCNKKKITSLQQIAAQSHFQLFQDKWEWMMKSYSNTTRTFSSTLGVTTTSWSVIQIVRMDTFSLRRRVLVKQGPTQGLWTNDGDDIWSFLNRVSFFRA